MSDDTVAVQMDLPLPVQNPLPVYDAQGNLLGSANLEFVDGYARLSLLLAKSPEAFDLEVAPEKVKVRLSLTVKDVIAGWVVLGDP